MPDLIILRLYPVEPVDGSTFRNFLTGLNIKVFDLTFGDSVTGVQIGTASGLANSHMTSTTNNSVNISTHQILQHYLDVPDPTNPPLLMRARESAATVVIVANPPAGHPEYPSGSSFDIRLEITRGGKSFVHGELHYNVNVVNVGSLSNNQKTYFAMEPSAYVPLPSSTVGLDPSLAYVHLPADGSPPKFVDLVTAIDVVLKKDPGGANPELKNRPPLTAAESRQIAAEIVWNRELYPPPVPKRSIGELYTRPPVDPAAGSVDDIDRDRKQFEAALAGYHATHDAEALRLAGFVYAASAAVACEVMSKQANKAGLEFPVITGASTGTEIPEAAVILTQAGPLNPSFIVPAAFFYALGALLPMQVTPEQRYQMARLQGEQRLINEVQASLDSGAITVPAAPLSAAGPAINVNQAVRRLHALAAFAAVGPEIALAAPITTLVTDWLSHTGPTLNINSSFWTPEVGAQPAGYLELLLQVITEAHAPLIAAIKAPPLSVGSVANLVAVTDQQWRNLFLGPPLQTALLPPFTQPGTPAERAEAFVRHLKRFFAVPIAPGVAAALTLLAPPLLGQSIADIFKAFVNVYQVHAGAAFLFGGAPNAGAVQQAVNDVFPGDFEAQAWLEQAIRTIDDLFRVTDLGFPELHFSLMEALFARGFTSPSEILQLTPEQFQDALTGTIAYPHAAAIYAKAGTAPPPPAVVSPGFKPINPDGKLTDCVPPPHLSPFGPVAYLAELLRLSAASTCDQPDRVTENLPALGSPLKNRRGQFGDLEATAANNEIPLPMIDLVNESLEALTAGLPAISGAVYQTATEKLADHELSKHDPATLFAALPEHSSPATPVEKPAAYDKLKTDFTAPALPYDQPADISRLTLRMLGTTRFNTMRTFRRDITEFVIDPANEPADFQRHLWRYPIRFPIALEYLQISEEEYSLLYAKDIVTAPTAGHLLLRDLYGFSADTVNGTPWQQIVVRVPEFLTRTGLTYCQFLELWRSDFVAFRREGSDPDFRECLPCCPHDLVMVFPPPIDPLVGLRKLAVFVRLWRHLREAACPWITFGQLRDICGVLVLFNGDAINPEFLRQLAALLMLREMLKLPLAETAAIVAPGAAGADRTHLLAIWVGPAAAKWDWAVSTVLEHIDAYAEARYPQLTQAPELIKIIRDNLDPLSRLAGFDPATATDTWHAHPTHTLRFVEVLTKICTSEFTVGQLLFLFTPEDHLLGDDPFRLTDENESEEDPLNLPEDEVDFSLWVLREKLIGAEPNEEEMKRWTWRQMVVTLRVEFGFQPAGPPDPLDAFGAHFFPSILEAAGQPVSVAARQYRVNLAAASTSPLMWNTPPTQPFHYDLSAGQLWIQLPLDDDLVIQALQNMRPLTTTEQDAVRDLYFAPRAELAQFSFLFSDFNRAVDQLIHEPDENARWSWFQRQFAVFYKRCRIVARHLADHVQLESEMESTEGDLVAWKVLRHLWADENFGKTPWEVDSGVPPNVTWGPKPHGGSFAALLGLTGTGLLTEFSAGGKTVWRENSGALRAFTERRNEWNTPVPVLLPALDTALTPEQQRFVVVRSGLALRDVNGEPLGGAQPFTVRWTGVLMVEQTGKYRFHAGGPTAEGEEPDFESVKQHRWRLTLKRGQKNWILLNRGWSGEDAPDSRSGDITLRRGAYDIVVELEQVQPTFATEEEICRRRCGFEIKYTGPDTDDQLIAIPFDKLFRDRKSEGLRSGIDIRGAAGAYLDTYYSSTLRDMRRTYTRAFKAVLLAHEFQLSARDIPGDRQSELGYMIDHPAQFLGTSYPRTGPAAFQTHHAHFDFNLFPVTDPYRPPPAALDMRQLPSQRRQTALFNWWERAWDYTLMRTEAKCSRERPAWLLFYEASEKQPDDPPQLVRHLGVDIRHAPLVLTYFVSPAPHTITTPELEDERWAVRVWQGERWVRNLKRHFFPDWIGDARPWQWAAHDLNAPGGAPPMSGNRNLTKFVQNGLFENGAPQRYQDLTKLNNKLRERARTALIAFLCGMDRVPLPWGGHAKTARDLSDLLLQDVEVGVCQRASRIEEAISAVQKFVQRARLGLEPGFVVSPGFILLWDRQFATYRTWELCRRRWVYRENFIVFDELAKARKSEAFQFLESELRRAALTIPVPGGLEYWQGMRPPRHPGLTLLQHREPAGIRLLPPTPEPEGLDLMGTPERDARPSWLAPLRRGQTPPPPTEEPPAILGVGSDVAVPSTTEPSDSGSAPAGETAPIVRPLERLPLWIQAAIRLGIRFVRVAAAGIPPASADFRPRQTQTPGTCCIECGRVHPPVIDEYYFWLGDARYFSATNEIQNADQGATPPDMISDWHRPDKLPGLLEWESEPVVHLFWCRVHNGEFKQRRRSDCGLRIDPTLLPPGGTPQLDFMGRTGDSLRFEVSGGVTPIGFTDPTPPGFRYDMATDSALVLPLLVTLPAPLFDFPGALNVYPYFAYFDPGAPLLPVSVFSESVAVAGFLRAHCRFEAALKWYELFFNPLKEDLTWAVCPPETPPAGTVFPTDSILLTHSTATPGGPPETEPRVTADIACCPSTPVTDEVAKRRAVTLESLETLLQTGEALVCRNTPEGFGQATVLFETMRYMLGSRPPTIFAADDETPQKLSAFTPRPPGLNPRLLSVYDRASDRLSLIHNCLNGRRLRGGKPNLDMPFFGNSPLRDGWKHTVDVCADEDDWCILCCKPYRFSFLVQKALELALEVKSFGSALLAAYEKGDVEYLNSLRAMHERQLLALALEIRQNEWREADWTVQALQKSKEGAQTRQRHYQTLIVNGLNAGELGYEALTDVSMMSRAAGNVSEAIAQGMGMVPDMWVGVAGIAGTPLQFSQLPLGNKLAYGFATAARILNALAEIANSGAALSLTQGNWDRREEEWRHQVEVIGIEIEQIERQILATERRRDMTLRELNNHQRQIENSSEILDFLRDKFTSHELYLHLQQETAALHRQIYELALGTARLAQRAFNYERGYTARTFLPTDAWDNLHEALLAGDKLQLAVRQMEKAYQNQNCREYELTKHISLRLHFPHAFLQLQMTGYCEIEIPEWMFDMDYPGHYMRRIKNVSVTIPAVAGPYTGVHCRLTLLSSSTRIDPRLNEPPVACCDAPPFDGYQPLPDDQRIVRCYAAREAIATSSGQNDAGLFELNFRDDRYLPFEFAGAVSRWRIELPPENNYWPAETLNDYLLHVNYTSLEGGEVLRREANRSAQLHLPGNGVRFFDIRNEFPDAWQALHGAESKIRELHMRLGRSMFPFVPGRGRPLHIHRIELFLESEQAQPSASVEVDFFEGPGAGGEDCPCARHIVTCVASSEWPLLYHGVLDIELGPLDPEGRSEIGWFRFPKWKGDIQRAFVLCGYRLESLHPPVSVRRRGESGGVEPAPA